MLPTVAIVTQHVVIPNLHQSAELFDVALVISSAGFGAIEVVI